MVCLFEVISCSFFQKGNIQSFCFVLSFGSCGTSFVAVKNEDTIRDVNCTFPLEQSVGTFTHLLSKNGITIEARYDSRWGLDSVGS